MKPIYEHATDRKKRYKALREFGMIYVHNTTQRTALKGQDSNLYRGGGPGQLQKLTGVLLGFPRTEDCRSGD